MGNNSSRKTTVLVINVLVLLFALFGLGIFTAGDDGGEFIMHLLIAPIFVLLGIVRRNILVSRWSSKLNAAIPFLFALSFPLPVIIDGSLSKTMRVTGFTIDSTLLVCLIITTIIEMNKSYLDIN